jgi:hypothetical protein
MVMACSHQSARERLDESWPRAEMELRHYDNHQLPDPLEIGSSGAAAADEVAALIDAADWGGAAVVWFERGLDGACFMGINATYHGTSGGAFREWARWHVREFEKALAILSGAADVKDHVRWKHGSLARSQPVDNPLYDPAP